MPKIDFDKIEKKIVPFDHLPSFHSVVFYGRSGTGKTTLACDFPKPLLLLDVKDKGTNSVRDVKGGKVLPIDTWDDFEMAWWYIKKKGQHFKSIVVDTVSNLQSRAVEHVLEQEDKEVEDAGNWGTLTKKDWGAVSTKLQTWINNYRDLPNDYVVFIGQERIFGGGDEETDDGAIKPEVGVRLMPSVRDVLNAAVDLIGNTFIREDVQVKKDPKTLKKTEKRRVQFCLRIGPHSAYTTKIRKPKDAEAPRFIENPDFATLKELTEGK